MQNVLQKLRLNAESIATMQKKMQEAIAKQRAIVEKQLPIFSDFDILDELLTILVKEKIITVEDSKEYTELYTKSYGTEVRVHPFVLIEDIVSDKPNVKVFRISSQSHTDLKMVGRYLATTKYPKLETRHDTYYVVSDLKTMYINMKKYYVDQKAVFEKEVEDERKQNSELIEFYEKWLKAKEYYEYTMHNDLVFANQKIQDCKEYMRFCDRKLEQLNSK